MNNVSMLTPHKQLVEIYCAVKVTIFKDLWNSLWTTNNTRWTTLRITIGTTKVTKDVDFRLVYG